MIRSAQLSCEAARFVAKSRPWVDADPHCNVNLTRHSLDFALAASNSTSAASRPFLMPIAEGAGNHREPLAPAVRASSMSLPGPRAASELSCRWPLNNGNRSSQVRTSVAAWGPAVKLSGQHPKVQPVGFPLGLATRLYHRSTFAPAAEASNASGKRSANERLFSYVPAVRLSA